MADRLPVELWFSIMGYACTDGGSTSRAVALTCRFLHTAVQPLRFHSVALLGASRLYAFASHLRSLTSSTAPSPPITHLLVSVSIRHFGSGAMSDEERTALHAAWDVVITHAAPTLRTLFVHAPPTFDPTSAGHPRAPGAPIFTPPPFPMLEVLALPWFANERDATVAVRLPRLRYVHLASASHSPRLWDGLVRCVPRARRVRLSGVGNTTENARLGAFVRAVLGVRTAKGSLVPAPLRGEVVRVKRGSAEEAQAHEVQIALGELEGVWVQMYRYGVFIPDVARRRAAMVAGLERVMRDCHRKTGSRRMVLVSEGNPAYELEEAMEDWMDWVVGGDGPWRVPKEQVVGST